jgi:hypothetical protein
VSELHGVSYFYIVSIRLAVFLFKRQFPVLQSCDNVRSR